MNTTSPRLIPYLRSTSRIASLVNDLISFILLPFAISGSLSRFSSFIIRRNPSISASLAVNSLFNRFITLSRLFISSIASNSRLSSDLSVTIRARSFSISLFFASSSDLKAALCSRIASISRSFTLTVLRNSCMCSLASSRFISAWLQCSSSGSGRADLPINLLIAALIDTPLITSAFTSSTSTPGGVFLRTCANFFL